MFHEPQAKKYEENNLTRYRWMKSLKTSFKEINHENQLKKAHFASDKGGKTKNRLLPGTHAHVKN
jgi:hypothetical protein